MSGRELAWEGCVNVRDLGGLPTGDGGTTRFGAVVRADNVRRLTPTGWEQLFAYGIRTVVDLRFEEERSDDPSSTPPVTVVPVSLFGVHDHEEAARVDALTRAAPSAAGATTLLYLDVLESCRASIGRAVRAVADAPEGGVVVHCFVGKDRTGIVAALVLRVAGVPEEIVAEDYAISGLRVAPLVDEWIEDAWDEHERAFRTRICAAPVAGMLGALQGLRERYGDAAGYLRSTGLGDEVIGRLRARLVA